MGNNPTSENKHFSRKKPMNLWLIILIVAVCIFGILFICDKFIFSPKVLPAMNASISLDNSLLTVTNLNNYDWHDVNLALNDTYKLHASVIKGSNGYRVMITQFTSSDGATFNPANTKALKLTISCKNIDGLRLTWAGNIK